MKIRLNESQLKNVIENAINGDDYEETKLSPEQEEELSSIEVTVHSIKPKYCHVITDAEYDYNVLSLGGIKNVPIGKRVKIINSLGKTYGGRIHPKYARIGGSGVVEYFADNQIVVGDMVCIGFDPEDPENIDVFIEIN